MDNEEFRDWSLRAAKWGSDYRQSLRNRPVRAQTSPGESCWSASALPRTRPVGCKRLRGRLGPMDRWFFSDKSR